MSQHCRSYYYEDGDVILIVAEKTFKLHRAILADASEVFDDMFKLAQASDVKDKIPQIPLSGDSAEDMELLFWVLYEPDTVEINWDELHIILNLADKYLFGSVFAWCEQWISVEFHERPIEVLILADKFTLSHLYKESSKLILDDFPAYRNLSLYKQLSDSTQQKLQSRYQKYCDGILQLKRHFGNRMQIDNNEHTCQNPNMHRDLIKIYLQFCIWLINEGPEPPAPSNLHRNIYSDIFHLENNSMDSNCDAADLRRDETFLEFMGEFEQMVIFDDKYDDFYIFIEEIDHGDKYEGTSSGFV
ncbi:hypothetical protein G9A89_023112 [Geosiphon pyriformis]|nr:hypothetical protein G9A89_023112 [Geosiphon pyriformis]